MQKVDNSDRAAQLNLIELVKDYRRKLTPGCVARVFHQQDDDGATLVLHVAGSNVDDAVSMGNGTSWFSPPDEALIEESQKN